MSWSTAGQSRGVPIAAVLSPAETLGSEHFRSVGALTAAAIAEGVDVTVPGRRVRRRRAATGVTHGLRPGGRRRSRLDHIAIRAAGGRRTPSSGEPAVRRSADSRSRRDRRGRRTRASVRRSRRRGHQDRERHLSGRSASNTTGSGDEPIVGVDPPQRVRARAGPAQPRGCRHVLPTGRRAPTRCSPTSSPEPLRPWAFRTRSCVS